MENMTTEERLKATEANRLAVTARINALPDKRRAAVLKQMKDIPTRYVGLYQKAVLGELSKSQAIKAYCQNCSGYEDINNNVGDCTALACVHWAYRPYQK